MKVFGVIIGGGIALMALGIATAHWQAPGMLSHVTGQAGSIEQRVETAARAAIDALGYEWAEIEADGQIVTLRGLAPREEERVLAVNALLNAHGQGGFWRGGVISVVDRSEIAPVASPFVWRASRRDGEVRITGVVPSREARRDLLEFAASAFPEPVRAVPARRLPSWQA